MLATEEFAEQVAKGTFNASTNAGVMATFATFAKSSAWARSARVVAGSAHASQSSELGTAALRRTMLPGGVKAGTFEDNSEGGIGASKSGPPQLGANASFMSFFGSRRRGANTYSVMCSGR